MGELEETGAQVEEGGCPTVPSDVCELSPGGGEVGGTGACLGGEGGRPQEGPHRGWEPGRGAWASLRCTGERPRTLGARPRAPRVPLEGKTRR